MSVNSWDELVGYMLAVFVPNDCTVFDPALIVIVIHSGQEQRHVINRIQERDGRRSSEC